MFDLKNAVSTAATRIRPYVSFTPLMYAHSLSTLTAINVYLKLENIQPTHAFKVRGALNKLLSLTATQKDKGVVAASTGNHGAAIAYGCRQLQIKSKVFVPQTASTVKVTAIKSYGAEVQFYGTESGATEQYAHKYAQEQGMTYISPYNDKEVIAGQGTIAYELAQQLETIDAVLVPVGGGGLIAGIAGYVKSCSNKTAIIGCLPQNSQVMAESIKAGKIITMNTLPTLADALGGNIELGSITFALCQHYVDDYFLVTEQAIAAALRLLLEQERLLVEGAVGTALAALHQHQAAFRHKNVVIIVSGANISLETLQQIMS